MSNRARFCRPLATLAGRSTGRGNGERLECKVLRTLRFGAELHGASGGPAHLPPGVTFSGDFYELPKFPPCMNAPAIPEASALDAQFLVKRDGGTTETAASTITFKDSAGVPTTARLSKNWFVGQANGITTQTLRIEYPDWDGKDQNAWLLGNPKDGYAFVTYSAPNSSQTLDTDTCVSQGLCSAGASIEYVGADGYETVDMSGEAPYNTLR